MNRAAAGAAAGVAAAARAVAVGEPADWAGRRGSAGGAAASAALPVGSAACTTPTVCHAGSRISARPNSMTSSMSRLLMRESNEPTFTVGVAWLANGPPQRRRDDENRFAWLTIASSSVECFWGGQGTWERLMSNKPDKVSSPQDSRNGKGNRCCKYSFKRGADWVSPPLRTTVRQAV